MSAPLIWIVFPVLGAVLLWALRKNLPRMILGGMALTLVLLLCALFMPIEQPTRFLGRTYLIQSTIEFLGRRLVIENTDRSFLALMYGMLFFWLIGAQAARTHFLFISFSLAMTAFLIAARAVQPSLYAALLIEMAVLLSIPMLMPPGRPYGQGLLRFLIFQTLGVPFILLAGWALGQVEINPTNAQLTHLAMILMGFGLAFWLAIFPFYTWLPQIMEETHPYTSGFLFLFYSSTVLFLGVGFLNQFPWLRNTPVLYEVMQWMGVVMIATAGVWAAFQNDLSRLFGYGMIVETGFSLLALSLNSHLGDQLFASMFLTRCITYGLWSLSLSVMLQKVRSTRFEDISGLLNVLPYASIGLAVASLSIAGLPLLGQFPIRLALMEEISRQAQGSGVAVLVGSVGMLFSVFRALSVLSRGSGMVTWQRQNETRMQITLLVLGTLGLLIIGILPQLFFPFSFSLFSAYPHLP